MQHDGAWSLTTALCLLVYSTWGDREAHVQPASEGTGKGPDTAEFTAQAGEGWSMMLLNCPPLALSLLPSSLFIT